MILVVGRTVKHLCILAEAFTHRRAFCDAGLGFSMPFCEDIGCQQVFEASGTPMDEQTDCHPKEPAGLCGTSFEQFAGLTVATHRECQDYDWLFWVDCDLFFMNPTTRS